MALMWASTPKCANCDKSFTVETLDTMFSKQFRRGPLRKQAIQNLLEQEMSLLPETMIYVQREQARIQYNHYELAIGTALSQFRVTIMTSDAEALARTIQVYQEKMKILDAHYQFSRTGTDVESAKKGPVKTIKCPREECRGYIPTSGTGAFHCALCLGGLCSSCRFFGPSETILRAHRERGCNPQDLENVKAIRENTVPCPKCGVPIEKIDGCNQMWCTSNNCNTAFNWQTGHIINGPIHNPHYHEYLRRLGNAVEGPHGLNLDCNRNENFSMRAIQALYSFFPATVYSPKATSDQMLLIEKLYAWCRVLNETYDYLRADRLGNITYDQNTYRDFRVDFLRNRLSKEDWATKLSTRETIRIKNIRIGALNDMFRSALTDIFQNFYTRANVLCIEKGQQVRDAQQRTSNFIKMEDAEPLVKDFTVSCENLRVYYIQSLLGLLKDYTHSSCYVMEWYSSGTPRYDPRAHLRYDTFEVGQKGPSLTLRWVRMPIGEVQIRYNGRPTHSDERRQSLH